MKHILHFVTFLFLAHLGYSQAPEKFSFQGVARNAAGKPVVSRDVSIRISIRPETALGSPVYQETHTAKTTANGVFNIEVGGGAGVSGQFSNIDWKSGKYFLQLEMDPEGGSGYVDLGSTQLLSVPYAIHAAEAGKWNDFQPVIQKGYLFEGEELSVKQIEGNLSINETFMIWYPRKGAFRSGSSYHGLGAFEDANIGLRSFAAGNDIVAKGHMSVAMGNQVMALGNNSVAIGKNISIDAENTMAIGTNINSLARNSIAIGIDLQSRSINSSVFGTSNDISDALTDNLAPTHRLFQIGNGDLSGDRSNAMTILRNGNVGIGNNVLAPTHILDVGSRIRLRSSAGGNTAGLFLDNLNSVPYCFIGSVNNSEAGFYFEEGTAWRFNVHKNGSAWLAGTLTQNSDIRLKEYLKPLSGSLDKLYDLKGYHYQWKDKTRSQALQTGLVAQEVETVFPELVETDKEGYKSVNYIGLIPHLLEAVKELKQENAQLRNENEKLSSKANKWSDMEKRIQAIEASLVNSQATSSK